jgi:hypothetical protein
MNQLAKYDEAMKHLRAMTAIVRYYDTCVWLRPEQQIALHDAQHFMQFGEMANEEVKKA